MKMRKIYQLFTVLILYPLAGATQSTTHPEAFGPEINSLYDEINPVVSSDGKTLFFTRVNHPENKYGKNDSEDIWVSYRTNDSWSPAVRVAELNIGRYNSVLNISEDGNTLLLNGVYNKKGNTWKKRGLSVSTKQGDRWGAPVKLKVRGLSKRNKGLSSTASMSADGQLLLLSFSTTYNSKNSDLFVSRRKKKKWSRPSPLRKLNSPAFEGMPFLSADAKTIYFTGGPKKRFDIYTATCNDTSFKRWTEPLLLQSVNSESWEGYFKLDATGCVGYFSSDRGPEGDADIYKVHLSGNCAE